MAVTDEFLLQLRSGSDTDKERVLEALKPFWEQAYGKESAIRAAAAVQDASPDVSNYIWRLIVTGFMVVFVGIVAAIAVAILIRPTTPTLSPETLVTIFTTIVGFLAGLLAPSPLQNKAKNG
jgi:tetrahydromethanopterin S-methyltransferase subunit C